MDLVSNDNYVPALFIAVFSLGWIGLSALLSVMSGWGQLASKFRSNSAIDGEKFRFSSMSIVSGIFPINYGNCVFITVGRSGFALSVLFLFRLFHPPLFISWSEIEAVRPELRWFSSITAVTIKGFNKRIMIRGRAGRKILQSYNAQLPSDTG